MGQNDIIRAFGEWKIRVSWQQDEEKWYFSVVDVVGALTEQPTPKRASTYWAVLKNRLKNEGAEELLTTCKQLKLRSTDGKMRPTDVADTKTIFRIIQSVPSKKAEPFKQWMARVASERIDEIQDPELAILRGADYYRMKGYSEGWINQRLQSVRMRKELTDEWKSRGIEKENLRDNMTDIELVLNMLAEVSTKAISQAKQPTTFSQSKSIAREGGSIAGEARENIEKRVGTSVVSSLNAKDKPALETGTPEIDNQ